MLSRLFVGCNRIEVGRLPQIGGLALSRRRAEVDLLLILRYDQEVVKLVIVWLEHCECFLATKQQLTWVDRHSFHFRNAFNCFKLLVADDRVVLEYA